MLGEAGVIAVRPSQWRNLAREVAYEGRLDYVGLDDLLEHLLDDLPWAPSRVKGNLEALGQLHQVRTIQRHLFSYRF